MGYNNVWHGKTARHAHWHNSGMDIIVITTTFCLSLNPVSQDETYTGTIVG